MAGLLREDCVRRQYHRGTRCQALHNSVIWSPAMNATRLRPARRNRRFC